MPIRVLVVDDSSFFQQRLKEMINRHPDLEVIGIASNGREAVDQTLSLKPDIITMDFEMPVMDGVSAVKLIMAQRPTPILMFSSLTYEGARVTLDALAAGDRQSPRLNSSHVATSYAVFCLTKTKM